MNNLPPGSWTRYGLVVESDEAWFYFKNFLKILPLAFALLLSDPSGWGTVCVITFVAFVRGTDVHLETWLARANYEVELDERYRQANRHKIAELVRQADAKTLRRVGELVGVAGGECLCGPSSWPVS